ncbi:MAG: Fe-S protein maturation auxiliary factor SufT [bacterium]|nr:Fe-S protein maturation auxiliary factor SufT [bacterium]
MVTTGFNKLLLEAKTVEALRTVFDPEIPVNIYDLGLIYGILIDDEQRVQVRMTLTSPTCPVAGTLPIEVENKVREIEGVADAAVELVWDPPWGPDMMSEEAKLSLNLF